MKVPYKHGPCNLTALLKMSKATRVHGRQKIRSARVSVIAEKACNPDRAINGSKNERAGGFFPR